MPGISDASNQLKMGLFHLLGMIDSSDGTPHSKQGVVILAASLIHIFKTLVRLVLSELLRFGDKGCTQAHLCFSIPYAVVRGTRWHVLTVLPSQHICQ